MTDMLSVCNFSRWGGGGRITQIHSYSLEKRSFGSNLLSQHLHSFYFNINVGFGSIAKVREVLEAFEPLKNLLWDRRMREFLHTEAPHS